MMQEGLSSVIEYTFDGVAMLAQFRNTDVSHVGPATFTTDPPWYVWHSGDTASGDYEWLNYITLDGTIWSAKLHCEYQEAVGPPDVPIPVPAYIRCWFEHKRFPNGEDNHDDVVINFLDWNSHPWQARLNPVGPPFPAQPTFTLKTTLGKVGRGENKHTPNKSLDVRAKQRLSFGVTLLPLACVYSVSPHVNSIVRLLVVSLGVRDAKRNNRHLQTKQEN